jgi:hypothetical protein
MVKPGKIQLISIFSLVSGILNIIVALTLSITVPIATVGIGLLCCPVFAAQIVLGVFEILYASKLLSNPPKPVEPSKTIAILEIISIITGNVLSMAAGIVMLVMYNDPEVQAWFDELNNPVKQAYLT